MDELFRTIREPIGILGILITLAALVGVVYALRLIFAPVLRWIGAKLKSLKVKTPLGTLEAGEGAVVPTTAQAEQCARHAEVDETIDALIEQKAGIGRKITAQQVRSIQEAYDDFSDMMKKAPRVIFVELWGQFRDALIIAALENHVLEHVDIDRDGVYRLHDDYVQDKLFFVAKSYRRTVEDSPRDLRPWDQVESAFSLLTRMALDRFVVIAANEWKLFRTSVEIQLKTTGKDHPAIERRLKRLLEGSR